MSPGESHSPDVDLGFHSILLLGRTGRLCDNCFKQPQSQGDLQAKK